MLTQRLNEIYLSRKRAGDLGLEIEVEGSRLPREISKYWSIHQDNSLRGESAEFVLKNPIKANLVPDALKVLSESFDTAKSELMFSRRTSVHVHLNMQKCFLQEVYTHVAMSFIMDNLMVEYAGPDRIGNLFCLRAQDAEYLPMEVALNLASGNYFGFMNENIRYASINLLALRTYGSIEYRAMRGMFDVDEIQKWTDVIIRMRDASTKVYNDPKAMYLDLQEIGPMAFLRKHFPEEFVDRVTQFRNWRTSIERGSEYAFEIAYGSDWEDLSESRKAPTKPQPGECAEPDKDPRFNGKTEDWIDRFLSYEFNHGSIIRHGSGEYRNASEYVDYQIREEEAQRVRQAERERQRAEIREDLDDLEQDFTDEDYDDDGRGGDYKSTYNAGWRMDIVTNTTIPTLINRLRSLQRFRDTYYTEFPEYRGSNGHNNVLSKIQFIKNIVRERQAAQQLHVVPAPRPLPPLPNPFGDVAEAPPAFPIPRAARPWEILVAGVRQPNYGNNVNIVFDNPIIPDGE